MSESVLPALVFETQTHAAGLVVAKVRAAGDLEVAAVAGSPDFNVVSFRSTESEIPGAKLDGAVVQAKLLENCFGFGRQFLKHVE